MALTFSLFLSLLDPLRTAKEEVGKIACALRSRHAFLTYRIISAISYLVCPQSYLLVPSYNIYIRGEPARVSRLTFVALLNRAFAEPTESDFNTEDAKYEKKKKRLVIRYFFIHFLKR